MGNILECQTCHCQKEADQRQEIQLDEPGGTPEQQVGSGGSGSLSYVVEQQQRRQYPPRTTNPYQSKPKSSKDYSDERFKRYIRQIIKIQAWWRGTSTRKHIQNFKDSLRVSSKYFTPQDAKDTLLMPKYDEKLPREKRPPYTLRSGAIYHGEWRGGYRDGFGQQVWPDGARYIGQWKKHRAHGKGKFKHIDGDMYDGEWANDKANGHGEYRHQNGARYVGFWRDDLQHGQGTQTWPDHSSYQGMYFAGKKHGKGKYKWNDGSEYTGDWEDNKISGTGVYTWLDGRRYEGQWKNNNMEGYGIYTWKDGRRYQGQYKEDKKHGYGIYIWADGRRYEGWWYKAKQFGLGKYIVPADGRVRYGLWEDGKRIEWFDQQKVDLIVNQELDYLDLLKDEISRDCVVSGAEFSPPSDWKNGYKEQ